MHGGPPRGYGRPQYSTEQRPPPPFRPQQGGPNTAGFIPMYQQRPRFSNNDRGQRFRGRWNRGHGGNNAYNRGGSNHSNNIDSFVSGQMLQNPWAKLELEYERRRTSEDVAATAAGQVDVTAEVEVPPADEPSTGDQ